MSGVDYLVVIIESSRLVKLVEPAHGLLFDRRRVGFEKVVYGLDVVQCVKQEAFYVKLLVGKQL